MSIKTLEGDLQSLKEVEEDADNRLLGRNTHEMKNTVCHNDHDRSARLYTDYIRAAQIGQQ